MDEAYAARKVGRTVLRHENVTDAQKEPTILASLTYLQNVHDRPRSDHAHPTRSLDWTVRG